ncbi:small nuclear ribonucleoprotein SM D2 [Guillardia theta]|uniref:Small nuclear ribonucleoprotein Sm D2 n=1 Tax=Guillardia theta TaxID=55529 RepID=Q9AVX5_GUITH|nr:small nuclear ribonucleoprotein SM D2 [Guillardia theta]CAC27096.1 small nuclear ribonucleoprotein SM D2 [Guillardia theta]|mmetsp:Transcript_50741/g.158536  ORF Transcript_50741/g.158536 Transcript_50741/m.158536 type:complete len:83 (-) Transcript_50741:3155-3403(-)
MIPFDYISGCVRNDKSVMIILRNNKRMIGKIINYDKHLNLLLENVNEIKFVGENFSELIKIKSKFIPKVFLRGDNIVLILII